MRKLTRLSHLPRSIQIIAESLETNMADPEIWEMSQAEIANLRLNEDIILQLIFDRQYERWYLIAAGEPERHKVSELIEHDPVQIKRSILAIAMVDEAFIRAKRTEIENHQIYNAPIEFDFESSEWVGSRWV
jgi:hypothetical protein